VSTTTRYLTFERLSWKGPDAAIVVKLMMACNDMALANEGLQRAKDELTGPLQFKRHGATLYYSRLESSHLMEGFAVLDALRNNTNLMAMVVTCDERTRASFAFLLDYLPGGPRRESFERNIVQVRNNLTFHYDESGKQIRRAIDDRASRIASNNTSVTRGSSMHFWRWGPADDLIDTIVVRQIWKIPRDSDLEAAVNEIVDEIHSLVLRYVDFCGAFIWRYIDG
jgi:hypothetical protein